MHDALIGLELLGAILLLLLAIPLYFLPFIVASKRNLVKQRTVGWLNLFLGITTVGWIVLLIYASLANTPRDVGSSPAPLGV